MGTGRNFDVFDTKSGVNFFFSENLIIFWLPGVMMALLKFGIFEILASMF